jgi:hypothetical protein
MIKIRLIVLLLVSLCFAIDSKSIEENLSKEVIDNNSDSSSSDESSQLEDYYKLMSRLKMNKHKKLLEKRLPKWRIFDRPTKVNSEINYENDPHLRKFWEKNMSEKNRMYKNILG